jgi:hypothetical protein
MKDRHASVTAISNAQSHWDMNVTFMKTVRPSRLHEPGVHLGSGAGPRAARSGDSVLAVCIELVLFGSQLLVELLDALLGFRAQRSGS